MLNKILRAAKRLKLFTLDDIVMMTDIEEIMAKIILNDLIKDNKIKHINNYFEYIENPRIVENFKIINKNIEIQNSDITALEAIKIFLKNCECRNLSFEAKKAYKSFFNAHIIPYFCNFLLKDIKFEDVANFKKYLQEKKISEHRIKNILTLLNQVIKYFQNEGYIERTCIFEVKRLEKIPKREIQILTAEQLAKLFKIVQKNCPYLELIIKTMIIDNKKLND